MLCAPDERCADKNPAAGLSLYSVMEPAVVLAEIDSDLRALEESTALGNEINFCDRAAANDFIEVHVLDRLESTTGVTMDMERLALIRRAQKLQETFERTDRAMWTKLRRQIQTGHCPPATFRAILFAHTGIEFPLAKKSSGSGYDQLDLFVNGLLALEAVPEPSQPLAAEMVGYQKTPARILLELADLARPSATDIFVDLGSGLGQPVMLFHLLSGIPAVGIDIEPVYQAAATDCACRLHLPDVSFHIADIRHADLSDGTLFFMYTPVRKSILDEVLIRLRQLSAKSPFRLFTYGPCSARVGHENWLHLGHGQPEDPDSLCFFHSY